MPTTPETPGHRALRLRIETASREVGELIAKQCPPGHGFALFVFEYGEDGACAYVSNGEREDVIGMLEEWIARERKA